MIQTPEDRLPIGVFDSGVGGLTVLRAIHRALPHESTIYLGDTARVPYGPKSPETVLRYTREAGHFLLSRGVKALVIACNTATAHAAEVLASELDVPVLGVVRPGAEQAVRHSRSGRIGIIGTRGTIASRSYERAIRRLAPDAEIRSEACPLFVALAEEGWVDGAVARLTAERYLAPMLSDRIDTLVLGCTHYPLLKPLLSDVVGPDVTLVDSAEATASLLAAYIRDREVAAAGPGAPTHRFFVTDDIQRFEETAARFLGAVPGHLEVVELD